MTIETGLLGLLALLTLIVCGLVSARQARRTLQAAGADDGRSTPADAARPVRPGGARLGRGRRVRPGLLRRVRLPADRGVLLPVHRPRRRDAPHHPRERRRPRPTACPRARSDPARRDRHAGGGAAGRTRPVRSSRGCGLDAARPRQERRHDVQRPGQPLPDAVAHHLQQPLVERSRAAHGAGRAPTRDRRPAARRAPCRPARPTRRRRGSGVRPHRCSHRPGAARRRRVSRRATSAASSVARARDHAGRRRARACPRPARRAARPATAG